MVTRSEALWIEALVNDITVTIRYENPRCPSGSGIDAKAVQPGELAKLNCR